MSSGVGDTSNDGNSSMHILYTNEDVHQSNDLEQSKDDLKWDVDDTKFLFDKLDEYLPLVGPRRRFKCKKVMWKQISHDISNALGYVRTDVQCENRFKTVKRKNYRKCNMLREINLDESPRKRLKGSKVKEFMAADYLLPEKEQDDSFFYYSIEDDGQIENEESISKKKCSSIQETMLMIHQMKEESKERRHKEKMAILKTLINVLKK